MISCALMLLVAPVAVVSAQAPAGTGASEPVEVRAGGATDEPADEETAETQVPTEEEATPSPPLPAGVPAAEAPKAVEEEEDGTADESDDAGLGDPAPAGVGLTRPFGGIFSGAAPARTEAGHALDLTASLFGVHARGGTPAVLTDDGPQPGTTTYAGGAVGLDYAHAWQQASVGAFGQASLAYVPERADLNAEPWIDRWSAGGNAAIARRLGPRVNVSGNAQVDYSPYLQQDLLSQVSAPTTTPPNLFPPGLDLAVAHEPVIRSSVSGAIGYQTSPRSFFEGHYNLERRDLTSSEGFGYGSQQVGGRYVYRINRWVGLRAGYGYRKASFGDPDAEPIGSHELDIGADGGYGRSFSLARRTTFSFQTGSSIVVREQFDDVEANDDFGNRTHLVVNGTADLVHAWGQTWSANLGARRAVNYEVGFTEPLLTNEVYAAFGGLLAPRLDFSANAAHTAGSVGFGSGNNGLQMSYATSSLRLALTEWLAAYGSYFYYHHDFESDVTVPSFLSPVRDRQGVSVGLTTAFSLIGSRGRP
jgi:hypothetical protein